MGSWQAALAWGACVALAAGCGRYGFDANAGDDSSDGDAGGIVDAAVDGDGAVIDVDAAATSSAELRVTTAADRSLSPACVATSAGFSIVWHDRRDGDFDIYTTRISTSGAEVGDDVELTTPATREGNAAAVWTGADLGIAWEDSRDGGTDIYFARFDDDGTRTTPELQVILAAQDSFNPAVSYTGTEFAIAYDHGPQSNSEIFIARADAAGAAIGSPVAHTTSAGLSAHPAIVWKGSEHALVWEDDRSGSLGLYFERVGADGAALDADQTVVDEIGVQGGAALAWNGSEYGMAWEDDRDGTYVVYFARVSATGQTLAAPIPISASGAGDARRPSIAWTGTAYGLAWDQAAAIHFAVLDQDGVVQAAPVPISGPGAGASRASLAWDGQRFAVAWEDTRHGDEEIYARVLSP